MRKSAFTITLLGGIVLFAGMATATERHVPSVYPTIQAAINASVNGDTVLVADGTYTGAGNRDIDFLGKAITVKSENGPENCIIDCEGTYEDMRRGFYFHNGEGQDSIVEGFTIKNGYTGYGGGIYCDGASPTIINNVIANNTAYSSTITPSSRGGGIYCDNSSAFIANNLIAGNFVRGLGGGIYDDSSTIINNTITENDSNAASFESCVGGIYCTSSSLVVNTIIWGNGGHHSVEQISGCNNVTYSDIQGGYEGLGNINADPCFADSSNGDYHLKSEAGRWNPNSESWVTDAVTSPCIDAGNPGCPLGDEPSDANNVRINMGAYGGTAEASKTPADWRSIADLTNDWAVDINDLGVFVSYWLDTGECIPSDLDRDESIDFVDYAIFAQQWRPIPLLNQPPAPVMWEVAPYETGSNPATAHMTAQVAIDPEGAGVQYYFECREYPNVFSGNCTFPDGLSSGWINTTQWDVCLPAAGMGLRFRFKVRDTSPSLVESGWSTTMYCFPP
jgi:hypothetical protein